ncbi:hypothetical protein [Mucilaginibacter defluvii]
MTTIFRALSINAYWPVPLENMAPGHFPDFHPNPDFMPAMKKIYSMA